MKHDLNFEGIRLTLSRSDFSALDGQALACIVTEPADGEASRTVLLPATYGKRQEAFCALSLSLAMNGWRVVKFDLRNNEGASPGPIHDFCFLDMVDDIVAAALHARCSFGEFALVASSLAARAALRAGRVMPQPSRTALIMPVVHAGITVDAASDAKPYHKWVTGTDRDLDTGDVVDGFLVSRRFIARAMEADLLSATGTASDLAELKEPITAIFSLDDAWINASEAEELFSNVNRSRTVVGLEPHKGIFIEGVSHELGKNPILFRTVLEIVAQSLAAAPVAEVRHVPFRLVVEGVRRERELLRQGSPKAVGSTVVSAQPASRMRPVAAPPEVRAARWS